jgi:regulator of sirC expression with transglutaminase-like and TPR domain
VPLKKSFYLTILCSIVFFIIPNNFSYAYQQPDRTAIEVIEEILLKPTSQIDLAQAKLTIDKLIDPSINIDRALGEINYMAQNVNSAATPGMTAMDRMQSLRTYLYDTGPWNQNQPFQYDYADPLGTNIQNKLLPTYLKTRKGNCISMPFLFVILADKLGLNATVATSPLHVLVKFKTPQNEKWINLEATDIAQSLDDSFYHQKSPMTATAINNGVYLQPLSKKEAVAVMAVVLSEYYAQQKQWQKSIDVSTLILKYYPKFAYAMIKIGNAYSKLLDEKIAIAGAKESALPAEKAAIKQLNSQNLMWFDKAEKMGWQPPTQDSETKYLQSIKKRMKLTNTPTTQNKGE